MNEYSYYESNDADNCCRVCKTHDDLIIDENGDLICDECLFEETCEEMMNNPFDEDDE